MFFEVWNFVCRIMRAQNLGDTPGLREYMMSTRVFEINCNHPIIQDLDVSTEHCPFRVF